MAVPDNKPYSSYGRGDYDYFFRGYPVPDPYGTKPAGVAGPPVAPPVAAPVILTEDSRDLLTETGEPLLV